MMYLIGLAFIGVGALVSYYTMTFSLDLHDIKKSDVFFTLPTDSAYAMSPPEDNDRRFRVLGSKDKIIARVSDNGIILPDNSAYLIAGEKIDEETYTFKYIATGEKDGKEFGLIESLSYRRRFSVGGDRLTHYLTLSSVRSFKPLDLRKNLPENLREKVMIATINYYRDSTSLHFLNGSEYTVGDIDEFDPEKPYRTVLVKSCNESSFGSFVWQNDKVFQMR